jgi:hypothetical protein
VTFLAQSGSFEDHFSTTETVTNSVLRPLRASLGLFQWLQPFDDNATWTDGTCVGYQESMLAVLQDGTFDAARSFGVIAVLMGGITSLWAFLSSCIAWNWVQLLLLRSLLLVGTIASGLSLVMLRADVCNEALPDGTCELAEGGMVLIAGMILWLAAFLIAVVFLRPHVDEWMLEEQEAMDEIAKARQAGDKAARRAMATAGGTPDTKGSFDSSDSVNSYQNRQRGVRYLQKQEQPGAARSVVRSLSPAPVPLRRSNQVAPTRLYDSDTGQRATRPGGTTTRPGGTTTRLYDSDTGHVIVTPPAARGRGLVATRMAATTSRPPTATRRAVASPPVHIAPRQGGGASTRSAASRASTLTIDDVSQRNELEVYIGQKMQRINVLMSDSSAEI